MTAPLALRVWITAVDATAPDAPPWVRGFVARMLAAPKTSSDALLILADALTEARDAATQCGEKRLALQLHLLADLPRGQAHTRAMAPPGFSAEQ